MEALSRERLALRAARVAAIEKETDPAIARAQLETLPAPLAPEPAIQVTTTLSLPPPSATRAAPIASDCYVTSTTVSSPPPHAVPSRLPRLVGAALGAVLVVGLAAAGGYLVSGYRTSIRVENAPAVAAAPPVPAAPAAPGTPVPSGASPASTSPASAGIASPPASASATPATPPPAFASATGAAARADAPPLRPAALSRAAAPAGKKPVAVDCSVPYVVDSGGIRRLKPECL